jgi:AcrR family transcriptional regulator
MRRRQIVEAAASIINERGIQNLSLSTIEKKVRMSRGQLTYYFKTKEDILLALFDHLLQLMCKQHGEGAGDPLHPQPLSPGGARGDSAHPFANLDWLQIVEHLLRMVCQDNQPGHPDFHALQYTFLSQMSHREDFRKRLASLYEEWRSHGVRDLQALTKKRPAVRRVSPRAMSTLVQALLHGLAMQKAADPDAVDAHEVVPLCLDLLRTYLWSNANGRPPMRRTNRRIKQGASHERNGQ